MYSLHKSMFFCSLGDCSVDMMVGGPSVGLTVVGSEDILTV